MRLKRCDRMESRSVRRSRARNCMLRVGYPATLPAELFRDFPAEVELIPISDKMDHDVEIDVWIPDPYSTKAIRAWPRLRGVKLVLAMMAGTEWIPETVGPACNHLQCAWRAQHLNRRMDAIGNPGHAEVLSALSRHSTVGHLEAAVRGQRALRQNHRRHAHCLSARTRGRADGQDGAAGWIRSHR
jgi:hypothetical protein